MSKKIISLLLTAMLAVSMVAVAAVSVSAEVDEQGRYTPDEGTETNRYYFYMPSDWYNDCATQAGVYWWEATDAPTAWPGYNAQSTESSSIYYCDVPTDAATVIWNNGFDGGEDVSDPNYTKALQTVNISADYMVDGDSEAYSSEFFKEMEDSFNGDKAKLGNFADNFFYDEENDLGFVFSYQNMIYVINPDLITVSEKGKSTCGGEWYFYFGDGTYGTYPTAEESAEKGCLYSTDYQPPKADPTEPATEVTTEASTEATTEDATSATSDPEADNTLNLTVNATSNYFPMATAEYNKSTNEVVVTYSMKSEKNVLDTQWYLTYDPTVLKLSDKNTKASICPTIGENCVVNTEFNNQVIYTATNLNLFDFSSNENTFAQFVFDVKDISAIAPTTTTVDLTVDVLRVSNVNPSTDRSDENEEVILVDNCQVQTGAAESVKVDTNTTLTPSTYVPETEPTTEEPTEATTEAPTEEPTEEPTEATTVSVNTLDVTAMSNICDPANYTVNWNDGETKTVTVSYFLDTEMDVLNTQWLLTYNPSSLTLKSVSMPFATAGAMYNSNVEIGEVKGSCSNINLYEISADVPFVTATFDVVATGETLVDLHVEELTLSEVDPATGATDESKETAVVMNGQVLAPITANATITEVEVPTEPSTEPTTEEPTEPSTDATDEPSTEEPTEPSTDATDEPSTEETEPSTDATESTGSTDTTDAPATFEPTDATSATEATTVTSQSTVSNVPGNGNAVQTGDSSLAVIILSILIGSTAVMLILRKRENY